jgi:D-glycero-alpha-D-manno-heptose-7-phosphate kinase
MKGDAAPAIQSRPSGSPYISRGTFGPKLVVTATPVRISFAGGGSDFGEYYRLGYGAVLSTTIDKFIYVMVKRHGALFGENFRLNYYDSEHVQDLDNIKNDIIRECLRLVPLDPPLYISTIGDMPAFSGLGSSSSFAVGLIGALHAMRGERTPAVRIFEEAASVELEVLKRPMGKQDHAAAAFGGLNYIRFHPDDSVSIRPVNLTPERITHLFSHFQFFWTGMKRDSSDILREQRDNSGEKLVPHLTAMRHQALELCDILGRPSLDMHAFGALLDRGWQLKRNLASSITTSEIDRWYETGLAAGALGGKLSGAGGGGFLLFVTPPERQMQVREALSDLEPIPIAFEPTGTRLLLPAASG